MEKIDKLLRIVFVAVIVVSFFLPWISVESAVIGGVTKLLTGKHQAVIDSVSGFDVPVLANSEESRFMISVIKIFNPTIKDADKKSFLIWGVPGLAVAIYALIHFLGKDKWVHLGVGILGVLIFVFAVFKITTTELDKLVLKVNIAYGLWLILVSYLGIGVLSVLGFLKLIKQK